MKQKTFFLVWQVLSFKLKKQTSKNVVDTTFKSLIASMILSYKSNILRMCMPKSHVVYSPKKNFKKLQLHQTLIFLAEFWHISRS